MTRKGSTESFFFISSYSLEPIMKGSQNRNSRQKPGHRSWRKATEECCLLACSPSLTWLFYTIQCYLPRGGIPMEEWTLPYQENVPAGLHTGQADRAIFTIGLLSSQMTQTSVKLTKISWYHVYFLTNSYFFKTKFSSLAVRWHLEFSLS